MRSSLVIFCLIEQVRLRCSNTASTDSTGIARAGIVLGFLSFLFAMLLMGVLFYSHLIINKDFDTIERGKPHYISRGLTAFGCFWMFVGFTGAAGARASVIDNASTAGCTISQWGPGNCAFTLHSSLFGIFDMGTMLGVH